MKQKPVRRITIENLNNGAATSSTVIELFPCEGGRRDQFAATLNGKSWHSNINASVLFVLLRKMA